MNKLSEIQSKVKAPKGNYNQFGKYNFRSCEDIVEAVKPIVNPMGFYLTIVDEVVMIGPRYYVKATATLSDGAETFTSTAYAREEETKKGMDASQITGAASSYARKYALNGLFAIDDTKDAEATNTSQIDKLDVLTSLYEKLKPLNKLSNQQIAALDDIIANRQEGRYDKAMETLKSMQ